MSKISKLTLLLVLLTISSRAQDIFEIPSKKMDTHVPVLIQPPKDYEPSKSYPLVFMLHGWSEDHTQWNRITDLAQMAQEHQMILVCPEGFTSYYMDSPKLQKSQYASFFMEELVPWLQNQYRIDEKNIFITGLSMGGYGALRLFLTHPGFFNTAASTSGALELDYKDYMRITLNYFGSDQMMKDLERLLGDPQNKNWEEYRTSYLLKHTANMNKGFLLDCGLKDPFLSNTLKIRDLALELGLPIRFSIEPGGHNGDYWKKSIEHHMVYFEQHLK